jgi:uncharacterized protein YjeT (DUF2065 family)
MRRNGLTLLAIGVVVFLVASSQRRSYDSVEGVLKTTFSKDERGKSDLANMGRWVGLGLAAVGLVLVVLPERKG